MVFESTFWLVVVLVVSCILSSIMSGVFGIGGGFFVVPALNFVLTHFYDPMPNTMAIATTTSLCNICIVNGVSSYVRRSTLSKLRADLPWMLIPSAIGGVIGSFVTKMVSDDFLHILFPCFLFFIVVLRVFSHASASMSLFQGRRFHNYYYPFFLIPVGIVCVLCGIGGGLVIFPIMLSICGDKEIAVSVSSFNSLLLSFCSLLVTVFYPHTHDLYPVIYADIYLPMILLTVFIAPVFSRVGTWLHSRLSVGFLDVLLLCLILLIVLFQFMTF